MKILILVLVVILVLAAAPLLIIWSLNTLFPVLSIAYSLDTWAAAVILGGLVTSRIKG